MAKYIQSNGGKKRNFNQENYPARLSFRIEGEVEFYRQQKAGGDHPIKPTLQGKFILFMEFSKQEYFSIENPMNTVGVLVPWGRQWQTISAFLP